MTGDNPALEDPYARRAEHIRMLDREVDRQRASVSARANSALTRSTILIAAAGIGISAATGREPLSPLLAVSLTLAVLAAVCGIVALWPRTGNEHSVEGMKEDTWNVGADEASYILLHRKLDILKNDEDLQHDRARWLRMGFLLFGLSLVVLVLASAIN